MKPEPPVTATFIELVLSTFVMLLPETRARKARLPRSCRHKRANKCDGDKSSRRRETHRPDIPQRLAAGDKGFRKPVFEEYRDGEFPVAENFCRRHICLPVYVGMTEEDALYVLSSLARALQKLRGPAL